MNVDETLQSIDVLNPQNLIGSNNREYSQQNTDQGIYWKY